MSNNDEFTSQELCIQNCSGKETEKKSVFSRDAKTWREGAEVTCCGRLLQTRAAATGKARSPTVESRVQRTISDEDEAEHSRCRASRSAGRQSSSMSQVVLYSTVEYDESRSINAQIGSRHTAVQYCQWVFIFPFSNTFLLFKNKYFSSVKGLRFQKIWEN